MPTIPLSPPRKGGSGISPVSLALVLLALLLLVGLIVLGFLVARSRQSAAPSPVATSSPIVVATSTLAPPPTPTEPPVEEAAVLIPDTTKVLSGETIQNLISISEDGSIFSFSEKTSELEALTPGDVMIGDASDQAPFGFLRRVTDVSSDAQGVVVETDQATLEDAIEQGTVAVSRVLTPADVRVGTQRSGVALASMASALGSNRFVVNMDDVVLLDLDGDRGTTNDQVLANGSLSFEPRFDFELKLKGFRLKKLTMTSGATERAHLRISSEMEIVDFHKKVRVAHYVLHSITIWVGWVPVVLAPVLTIHVGLDGTAEVGFDVAVTQEATLTAGLRYANGKWRPVSDFSNEFTFTPPTLTANVHAEGYAGLQLAILVYGVAGPYGEIDGLLELEADINRVPWWELYGGLRALVGVRFEILGYTIADYDTTVFDPKFLLTQAESRPPATLTPTATLTLTPTPTPTATPTCPFDAQGQFAGLWQTYKDQLGCPLVPTPEPIQDAEQAFDDGHMFWRLDNDTIYIVYEKGGLSGTYEAFGNTWTEGDDYYSCAASPPPGKVQPYRGFGAVWCRLGAESAAIGWGLGDEAGFWAGHGDPLVQDFERGVIFRDSDSTTKGMAYVFFGDTGTFVRVAY